MRKFLDDGHARPFYVLRDYNGGEPRYLPASLFRTEQPIFPTRAQLLSHLRELNLGQRIDILTGTTRTVGVELVPVFGFSDVTPTPEYLDALRHLSDSMYGYGPDGGIPAGYTYVAQFIAHELCRSEYLDKPENAKTTASFALDLESVYDHAPLDGHRLVIGATSLQAPFDIHRQSGAPVIGNDRNDANLALSQLHCAIIRFHNAVADAEYFSSFEEIRSQVTLVFQDMVLRDFLPRITSQKLVDDIVDRRIRSSVSAATQCPAEAALAAFRTGHSMIRPSYAHWNGTQAEGTTPTVLLSLTSKGGALDAGRLPSDWPVDWHSMFDEKHSANTLHFAKRMDTTIVMDLQHVPGHLVQIEPNELSAAYRTLWFGAAARLMDGWTVLDALRQAVGGSEFMINPGVLVPDSGRALDVFTRFPELAKKPPLWWFMLREAELYGKKGGLAGVGARLFAETIIAAIRQSQISILRGDKIDRRLPGAARPARMIDLLTWENQPLDWYSEQWRK